jgi:hypothetical protein
MIRHSGTTLVEVLVAIFITALGLMGLLALFPLGAVSMARAIQDSRSAQAAASAAAVAEGMNIRNDPVVIGSPDVFVDSGIVGLDGKPVLASPDGPGYPVYVDPLVAYAFPGKAPGIGQGQLPASHIHQGGWINRQNVSFVHSLPGAIRWFTLTDDLTFQKDGPFTGLACPNPGPSGVVQREGRYSWAYLLRRPRSADKSVVDLTVVVYSGRGLQLNYNPSLASLSFGETAYGSVAFDTTTNIVSVYWGTGQTNPEKPAIRPGSWILDATMVKEVPPKSGRLQADPHGFFYRVVNVTEKPNEVDLELQTNPRMDTIYRTGLPAPYGVLVVMDNVVEVFEKGPGWRP